MKNILIFFVVVFTSVGFNSSELSKGIQKKIAKEIKSVFEVEDFILEKVVVSDEVNNQLKTNIGTNNLFKVIIRSKIAGYVFVDKALSKTDNFDYLVIFDDNLIIMKSKVLIYREDYGSEIGSKRWLKQFIGLHQTSEIKYTKEIKAISGATISARSFTIAINNLLKSIDKLRQEKII